MTYTEVLEKLEFLQSQCVGTETEEIVKEVMTYVKDQDNTIEALCNALHTATYGTLY